MTEPLTKPLAATVQMTTASLALVFVAIYRFWTGRFGWGPAAGWVMPPRGAMAPWLAS